MAIDAYQSERMQQNGELSFVSKVPLVLVSNQDTAALQRARTLLDLGPDQRKQKLKEIEDRAVYHILQWQNYKHRVALPPLAPHRHTQNEFLACIPED